MRIGSGELKDVNADKCCEAALEDKENIDLGLLQACTDETEDDNQEYSWSETTETCIQTTTSTTTYFDPSDEV